MTNRPTQAAAETLERKAEQFYMNHSGTAAQTMADFTRKVLEEVLPYTAHTPTCHWYKAINPTCSCGLAELMEGWRNGL